MMYFNNDKSSTNIDDEFEKENILLRILKLFNKYKLFIIIGIVLVIIIFVLIFTLSKNKEITNYLILNGEENITLYQGTDYVEPGFDAYNSKDEDLNNEVEIKSTLDTGKIGEYEITYTIGEVTKVRKITVIAKPEEYTYIYLKTINNSVNVYVKLNERYTEPGYQVFSSTGQDLTNQVKVTGSVDTSKKGNYKLIYSIVDSNGVTVSASRTVIVMDTEISLSLSTEKYTNKEVTINIGIADNYFDYLLLPDNTKVTESTYEYKVSSNGKYTFKVYNKKGVEKESTIEVKNIDKTPPTGSCTVDQDQSGSFITIKASDASGINKYEYNNKAYTNNIIKLSTYIDDAKVKVYDNAGNTKDISCKSVSLPVISNISNDGVIVTIKSRKVNSDIAGYYFSYTNQRPNKDTGGYLSTSNESIDVVRLPGTTYVWVEDKAGKISKAATITLSSDVIPLTMRGYSVLKGTKLSDYLKNKGWSLEELNKLIARSVRASGLYTKEGAATAALSLQGVLAQKYRIKIPYWMGGKTNSTGAYGSWGMYYENPTYEGYNYYGMDCGGFVNWSYKNTGIDYNSMNKDYYFYWSGIEYSKENGEVGDILRRFSKPGRTEHVAIIVGKTESAFLVAEAWGEGAGLIINTYPYDQPNDYTIIKGERLTKKYEKVANSEYPTGF